MAITREEKKAEAIRRMKAFHYFEPSIEDFEKYGKIMVNEPPYGAHYYIDDDPELVATIEELEKENNILVYAVIRCWTNFGQLDSLLYVNEWIQDWKIFDIDLLNGITFTCTINRDHPEIRDYGSIRFTRTIAAGLMREF